MQSVMWVLIYFFILCELIYDVFPHLKLPGFLKKQGFGSSLINRGSGSSSESSANDQKLQHFFSINFSKFQFTYP